MNGIYIVLASTSKAVETHAGGISSNLSGYLFSLINILVLFYLLKLILFKPITNMLNSRTESINKDIENAKNLKVEAETLKNDYQKLLNQIKKEAQEIIDSSKISAQSQADKIISDAKNDAERIIERAQNQAQIEVENALMDVKEKVALLAIEAASKVVRENMDNETNRKIVEEFINEVGAA